MVFSEVLFRKFLKTRAGIREGVPNTVLGFNESGTPEATPKANLGGGATELLESFDVVGSIESPLWTFSKSYPFLYAGGDYIAFKVIGSILSTGVARIGYRPNDVVSSGGDQYENRTTRNGVVFDAGQTSYIFMGEGLSNSGCLNEFTFTKQPTATGFFLSALNYCSQGVGAYTNSGVFNEDNEIIGDSISSIRFVTDTFETYETGTHFRLYGIRK